MQQIININERLKKYGTDKISHSKRTFYEHLIATGDLLKEWGCDENVCLAGYFHSFYGTEGVANTLYIFNFADREKLQYEVGEKAEYLVFLYCIAKNRKAYYEKIERGNDLYLTNRLTNEKIFIEKQVLVDLICLDIANFIEEFERQPLVDQPLTKWIAPFWFRNYYIKRNYKWLAYVPHKAQEIIKSKFKIDTFFLI
ncbi:DUF6817 domain-containing protein [Mastigocoleus testarum]|uniref:DUF6817 domain-containing protein n=1 Tax=Mastigocoleus testarum BC008 TaxID=371196 RepID=A0A0V8A196_9CYAN|nr:hypothetical protein [Mastigocoleus testarum]KST70374.1 hypothetical protein BC008_45070 [Mastigocoleus testarum BC008]